ncbi:MAG: hypothetical protein ACO2ZP_01265 [Bacteriovoracaceae bacterium]
MPKVPVYNRQYIERATPAPSRGVSSPNSLGDIHSATKAGRVADFAGAISNAGKDIALGLMESNEKERKEEEKRRLREERRKQILEDKNSKNLGRDAYTDFNLEINKEFYTNILNAKGSETVGIMDKFQTYSKERMKHYRENSLKDNPVAQEHFMASAENLTSSLMPKVGQIQVKGTLAWEQESLLNHNVTLIETMANVVASSTDDEIFSETMRGQIEEKENLILLNHNASTFKGLPKKTREAGKIKIVSEYYERLAEAIPDDDPDKRSKFIKYWMEKFTADTFKKLDKKYNKGIDEIYIQEQVDKAIKDSPSLKDASSKLKKEFKKDKKDLLIKVGISRLSSEWSLRETSDNQQESKSFEEQYDLYNKNPSSYNFASDDFVKLKATHQEYLKKAHALRSSGMETDRGTYNRLILMDKGEFTGLDLTKISPDAKDPKYRGYLDANDFEYFSKEQSKMKGGIISKDWNDIYSQTQMIENMIQTVPELMHEKGADVDERAKVNKLRNDFRKHVQDQINSLPKDKRKDAKETRRIIDEGVKKIKENHFFRVSDTFNFKVKDAFDGTIEPQFVESYLEQNNFKPDPDKGVYFRLLYETPGEKVFEVFDPRTRATKRFKSKK